MHSTSTSTSTTQQSRHYPKTGPSGSTATTPRAASVQGVSGPSSLRRQPSSSSIVVAFKRGRETEDIFWSPPTDSLDYHHHHYQHVSAAAFPSPSHAAAPGDDSIVIVDGSHGDELEPGLAGDDTIDFGLLDGCEEGDERAYKRRRIGRHSSEQHLFPSLDSWFTSSSSLTASGIGDAAVAIDADPSALSSSSVQPAAVVDELASNHSFTSSAPSSLFDEEEGPSGSTLTTMIADDGNSKGLSACSYDLRNTHEPASIKQEYPNYGSRGHTEADESKQHFQQWVSWRSAVSTDCI